MRNICLFEKNYYYEKAGLPLILHRSAACTPNSGTGRRSCIDTTHRIPHSSPNSPFRRGFLILLVGVLPSRLSFSFRISGVASHIMRSPDPLRKACLWLYLIGRAVRYLSIILMKSECDTPPLFSRGSISKPIFPLTHRNEELGFLNKGDIRPFLFPLLIPFNEICHVAPSYPRRYAYGPGTL